MNDEHAAAQGSAPEAGQSSPTTKDTGSDTVLISPSPQSLSRSDEPAHSPPDTDQHSSGPTSEPEASRPANVASTSYSTPAGQSNEEPGKKPSLTRQSTSNEPKKCWICFGDSTEDGPDGSPWRTPCPCALTAHEACLLDWIADLEAPAGSTATASSRKRKNKIQCPQCKTEIKVARPWSPIVAAMRVVERASGTMVLPGLAGVLLGGVFSACFVHGAMSVLLVLGPEDWARLVVGSPDGRPTKVGLRLTLGLPMVPVMLVLSRTRLAEQVLLVLPFMFVVPPLGNRHNLHRLFDGATDFGPLALRNYPQQLWHLSPGVAFATLPWVRAFYNLAFNRLFAAKQAKWVKAVQREPRAGEDDAPGAEGADRQEADAEDLEIQLNAEIQLVDDDEDEAENENEQDAHDEVVDLAINDAVQAAEERQRGQAAAEPELAEILNRVHEARQPIEPAGRQRVPGLQQNNNNQGLILSMGKIADTVLGALCFPAIATAMGEALKLGLPTKWTTTALSQRPGILQSRWGRSLIGGCLFVVMKDALILYSQYRLAQDHHKRRILDYKGPSTRKRDRQRAS